MAVALAARMDSRNYLLASIVFGVAVAGCATPRPLVRLAPVGGEVTWVSGRAVLSKQQSGVRVAMAFEHQDGDALAVRVEVANDSEAKLEVGPRDVFFVTCQQKALESCGLSQRVIDPEAALMALDVGASREAAAAANDAAFYTPLLILSAATDIASIASGKGDSTTGLQTAALANQKNAEEARHNTAMASYASQREMWSNAALRRNTVQPGRAQGGMVFVPIDLTAQYVWIQLRAGPRAFAFQFEQTVTQIPRPTAASSSRMQTMGMSEER
jgi:hypothetical protein